MTSTGQIECLRDRHRRGRAEISCQSCGQDNPATNRYSGGCVVARIAEMGVSGWEVYAKSIEA